VNPGSIEIFVNFYEVIFRDRGDESKPVYYRGTGTGSEGYVSVSVLPGKTYDVLLLAGYNRTLLGAGYVGVNSGDDVNRGPVTIESGRANVVSISVTKLAPQWDTSTGNTNTINKSDDHTNDFAFSATFSDGNYYVPSTPLKIENRYIHLLPDWTSNPDPNNYKSRFNEAHAKFTVTFNIAKLTPLIEANWNTNSGSKMLTIKDYGVSLKPRYPEATEDDFTPVTLICKSADGPVAYPTGSLPLSPPYTYNLTTNTVIAFDNYNAEGPHQQLPVKHVDGLLRFELKYHAFGTEASGGTLWFIRNGLNRTPDIGTNSGGDFLVKIGTGSAERTEPVTVSTQ
jgi:hypothetical protein